MTEPPGSEHTDSATSPSELDQERRTSMAAERTWLAWWRTALGATAGAVAVGLSIVGARRQRELEQALRTGGHAPLTFRTVAVFTVGGVALSLLTVVLVIAQT